jgi:hypothetical protein
MKWASLAVVLLAAACGDDGHSHGGSDGAVDCASESRAQVYSPGLTVTGDNGYTASLMDSLPAPPARNDNVWTVEIRNDQNVATADLTLDVKPWMPDHGHGAKVDPVVTAGASDGVYVLDPINLWMPGYWEVTINIADGQGALDSVVFKFCIGQ